MRNARKMIAMLALAASAPLAAQTFGEIHGKVVDDAGKPIAYASVAAEQGSLYLGTSTDDEGRYVLKPLPSGSYLVRAIFPGLPRVEVSGVQVDPGRITSMKDIAMTSTLPDVEVVAYHFDVPLINKDDPARMTITQVQIQKNAVRLNPVAMIASIMPGVTKAPRSNDLYFRGSRSGAMAYYVDGVKMDKLSAVPPNAISSISVYTGGLPACYGDVTGGVVAIETKSYFDLYQQRNAADR